MSQDLHQVLRDALINGVITYLKGYDDLRSVQDNPHSYWECISQDVALMRARDKVYSALTTERYAKDAKPAYIEVKRGSGKVSVSLGGID